MKLVRSDNSDFTKLWERLCIDSKFLYPLYQEMNLKFYKGYAQDSKFVDRSMEFLPQIENCLKNLYHMLYFGIPSYMQKK